MSTITIESKIKRTGGTRGVVIGETSYDFMPNAEGAHVCDIENPEHAQRFLGIPEGYRIYSPTKGVTVEGGVGASKKPVKVEAAKVEDATVADLTVKTEDPAANTKEPADETDNEPTPAQEQTVSNEAVALEDLDSDALRTVFQDEVGRAPHHKAKDETLIAQIEAVRKEKAAQ